PSYYHPLTLYATPHHQPLHSFPTRRSSDLAADGNVTGANQNERVYPKALVPKICRHHSHRVGEMIQVTILIENRVAQTFDGHVVDRKSTRLNSSHVAISYAVFCLKKKNTYQ